jgi:hypothetical protein
MPYIYAVALVVTTAYYLMLLEYFATKLMITRKWYAHDFAEPLRRKWHT